jgi:hypothetical protein
VALQLVGGVAGVLVHSYFSNIKNKKQKTKNKKTKKQKNAGK